MSAKLVCVYVCDSGIPYVVGTKWMAIPDIFELVGHFFWLSCGKQLINHTSCVLVKPNGLKTY